MPLLLLTETSNTPNAYLPIIMQLLFVGGLIGLIVVLTHLLGPSRKTKQKLENFECGIEEQGNARQPLAIKYFLVAILFVLLDIEVVFFYPYAVNFKWLGWNGFIAILVFVAIFFVGFGYILKHKVIHTND